jgi:outer membrane lipoprotein carrier protein
LLLVLIRGFCAGRFSREGVFLVVLFFAGFAKAEPFTDFFSETRTYRAEFIQTVLDEEMNVLERSSGSFVLSRPGRFLWAYGEPIAQTIVADGKRLWIYDPGLDQAIVRWQGKGLGETPAGLLANTDDPSANYFIERLGEQTGIDWVSLFPKSEDSPFSQIQLGFERNVLRLVQMLDHMNQVTRVRFENIQVNEAVELSTFEVHLPSEVDVIREDL